VRVCARGFWEIKHEKDEKVSSEGKLQARTASAIRMQFPLARRPSAHRLPTDTVKSSLYINNRHPETEAYRLCFGSQQWRTGLDLT
jgi:hypothetical protein